MIREGQPPADPATADAVRELKKALDTALTQAGFRYRLAPLFIVDKLQETLEELCRDGLFAESLYEEYRESLRFSSPDEVPEPRTLIVVASWSPAVKLRFQFDDGPFDATVPPTYLSSVGRDRGLQALRSVLAPAGFGVGPARGPKKLLAVRSGLAQYGRNNLAYVRGLGSKVRLDIYATDAHLGAEEYVNKGSELMSCCPPCRNCHHHCPTGCIPHAGTVIDAARCLTYLNENEGDWPDWLDPSAHNSLVGCMLCQELCPANRYYPKRREVIAEFDREETQLILENRPAEQLSDGLRHKLEQLDLAEYSTVLGRNLVALRGAPTA